MDGTVALSEGQVRVEVALVRAATGEAIRRQQLVRPRAEMFELQDELATQVALFLREMLGEEVELIERQSGAENVEAWELLQRARAQSDLATELADAGDESAWERMVAADSLLALAEERAPEWVEPTVRRGWLAYQQSRWLGSTDQDAGGCVDRDWARSRRHRTPARSGEPRGIGAQGYAQVLEVASGPRARVRGRGTTVRGRGGGSPTGDRLERQPGRGVGRSQPPGPQQGSDGRGQDGRDRGL